MNTKIATQSSQTEKLKSIFSSMKAPCKEEFVWDLLGSQNIYVSLRVLKQ